MWSLEESASSTGAVARLEESSTHRTPAWFLLLIAIPVPLSVTRNAKASPRRGRACGLQL